MKILAIIDVAPDAPLETIRAEIGHELMGSWQLFTAGVLREAYTTESPGRVVFVLEADDAAGAAARLDGLKLIAAGLLRYQIIELRPFANWSLLFARPDSQAR